ncbi:GTPase [Arthrobacter sp. H20]|uniref:GTPase n=1 Tax=Arthrobacter sp. H20 TaxID=1267981 RepID=UPI00047EA407|nr:GTPase [Arthrobacter sp. H20]
MSRHKGKQAESAVQNQLEALDTARELAVGRLPEQDLQAAFEVIDRASTRRSLSAAHTVVGIFGPTGSGKSSLLNALTGTDVARVAARRPTTSEPLAVLWNSEGSAPLLDWLQVALRHELPESSRLAVGGRSSADDGGGLILLDLPDFDSTAASHREVVERLAGQVDVLLWVVDPQKYADAALHHGFLRGMATHGGVTIMALNQTDRLIGEEVAQVTASLRGILAGEGLGSVAVHPVSASTGAGLDNLVKELGQTVKRRQAATARLTADVAVAANRLAEHAGTVDAVQPPKAARSRLADRLAGAIGTETVVDAVVGSYRRDAHAATGWPVTRWLGKLRPDPLRRLNLRRSDVDATANRTSLPTPGPAQRAAMDGALREYADAAAESVHGPWREQIRTAAQGSTGALADGLDQAIAQTDLRWNKRSWWWPVIGALQWLLFAAAVAGLVWLGVLAALGFLQLPAPVTPMVEGFPLPTLLAIGGAIVGIAVALLSAGAAKVSAASRGRRARRRLHAAVAEVAGRDVIAPVEAEIARYNGFRKAVTAARGRA